MSPTAPAVTILEGLEGSMSSQSPYINQAKRNADTCRETKFESPDEKWTDLVDALLYGAPTKVVRRLIFEDPSTLRSKDEVDRTPLHVACSPFVPYDVVDLLIDRHPTALYEKDRNGMTPLHRACCSPGEGDGPAKIRRLLECHPGALVEKDEWGLTPLSIACSNLAPLSVIQMLLELHPPALADKDLKDQTPLHVACAKGCPVEVVRLLVGRYPMSLFQTDKAGHTPLSRAQVNNSCNEVQQVLSKLANCMVPGMLNDDAVRQILEEFLRVPWWEGAKLVLNVRPAVIHKLHLKEALLPRLLAKVSQDCTRDAYYRIIREMTGMFKEAKPFE